MNSKDIYEHEFYQTFVEEANKEILDRYINLLIENQTTKSDNTEKHHIFPSSIFGKNAILVTIPMRIHFDAHVLLYEMFKERNNRFARKMGNAVHKMVQGREGFTSEDYEVARLALVYARQGTTTIYDKVENAYRKLPKTIVDNERYFTTYLVKNKETQKATWKAKEDPTWEDFDHQEPKKRYIDLETNSAISLTPSEAKAFPERYVHSGKGKKGTPAKEEYKNRMSIFDKATKEIYKIKKYDFNPDKHEKCSVYIDMTTRENVYIPLSLVKENPERYRHPNKGKMDVYPIGEEKMIKIFKEDFDPKKHEMKSVRKNKNIEIFPVPLF